MNKKYELLFLRKIAEKTCNCSIFIEISGTKFAFAAVEECVEVVHVPSRENIETDSLMEMTNFMRSHSPYLLAITDSQAYTRIIEEVMKMAMSDQIGILRTDLELLIGSLAEYLPDEISTYSHLLAGIK